MADDRKTRKQKVIAALNKARAMEMTAIHQYMNQHYNLDNMDFGELARQIKLIAIDEMRHAEIFADRIKELDGVPTTEPAAKTITEQKVEDVFPFDSNLEDNTIAVYNDFVKICIENGDNIARKLFEDIINEEQLHFNYFDNVHDHIAELGASYLAQIAGTPSSTGGYSKGFALAAGGAAAPAA